MTTIDVGNHIDEETVPDTESVLTESMFGERVQVHTINNFPASANQSNNKHQVCWVFILL